MTTTTLSPARNLSIATNARLVASLRSGTGGSAWCNRSSPGGLAARKLPGESGFTMVEVMISAFIGAFILAAVLSTFLFMGRSGANVQNYNDMEVQARNALEYFAEDTRQAKGVVWSSATSLALTVGIYTITYTYDATAKNFTRVMVETATPSTIISTRILVTGITAFAFSAYNISGSNVPLGTSTERTTANGTTKQVQISLEAARANRTVVAATNTVLSARFILRNKKVTA